MHSFINSPWNIGSLNLPHRLIQGPLAGYSCAPFRELFYHFTPPAYAVSEMISACDILNKHTKHSRFLYRSPLEKTLAYQISGHNPEVMAEAAFLLDGFMIARAASGKPWLYQELLNGQTHPVGFSQHRTLFMQHLHGLARLEDEYKAVLQSKSLVRYYFRTRMHDEALQAFYNLKSLDDINAFLAHFDDLVTHFDPHLHLKFDR